MEMPPHRAARVAQHPRRVDAVRLEIQLVLERGQITRGRATTTR